MEGTAYRTHPLRRTPTFLVDAACHSRQAWHALRNRIEIPQSYVRRADDLAFGIQNETTRITKGNTAIFLFSLLPVRRNFQTICAYDRRNAAHSHQLEQPQHQAMAGHTQHDAAMRHELLRIGNRRHACLELDDSISLRRTLSYKKTSSVSRDLFCYWYSPSYCSSMYSPHPAHTTVTLTYMALQQHHPHGFPYSTPGW